MTYGPLNSPFSQKCQTLIPSEGNNAYIMATLSLACRNAVILYPYIQRVRIISLVVVSTGGPEY